MLRENQFFSIGTVARIIGVSTHTLRAWEKRYNLNLASRSASGRREYPPSEIEKLKLIKSVLEVGYKISDVAHLSMSELTQLKFLNARSDSSVTTRKRRLLIYGKKLSHLIFQSRTQLRYQVVDDLTRLAQLAERESGLITGIILGLSKVDLEVEELAYSIKLGFEQNIPFVIYAAVEVEPAIRQRLEKAKIKIHDAGLDKQKLDKLLDSSEFRDEREVSRERQLSPQQIEQLQNHNSKIYCDCPQHLADIYLKFNEFIQYTENCEVLSPKDNAVHQHVNQQLSQMKTDITRLIWDVAAIDGIDL